MERHSEGRGTRGRRRAVVIAAAVVAMGLSTPARAQDGPLPDSCRLHAAKVVNPGCAPALQEQLGQAVDGLTGPVLDPPDTYPDLEPEVTVVYTYRDIVDFDPATGELVYGPLLFAFDTWSRNIGTVALDLLSDDPANVNNPAVSQCVSWTVDGVCRERREVGGFEVHPDHNHFHFNDFAQYELRTLLPDGTPDYSAAGLLDISEKVSFCLLDSWRIRDDARPVRTYTSCGSTREGISAGWADIYGGDLPGQQFPAEGLADGRYALVVTMDTNDRLWESDNGNNVLEVTVELSQGLTQATIVDRRRP